MPVPLYLSGMAKIFVFFKKEYGRLFLFDVAAYILSGLIAKGTLALADKTL